MPDYIAQGDGGFNTFVGTFAGYVNTHLTEFGIEAAEMSPINAAITAWNAAYGRKQRVKTHG